jgi:hypothetical protein
MKDEAQIAAGLKLYPNKDLREPIREYQSTVFELVKRTFAVRNILGEHHD